MEKTISTKCLSKDEWKLLMIYYYKIQQLMNEFSIPFNEVQRYTLKDLSIAFRLSNIKRDVPRYLKPRWEKGKEYAKDLQNCPIKLDQIDYLHLRKLLLSLSLALQADKLIFTDMSPITNVDGYLLQHKELGVSFERDGYKLAKEYSCFWHRLRLMYNAYIKNHPIIIILAFIIVYILGILSKVIVDWLTNPIS